MKKWTLTEQVSNLWKKCLDLMSEIAAESEPGRLERFQTELAASLAAVLYLFVNTQDDPRDFVKTSKVLIATVSTWVTTEITADRPDQIGTVEIKFVPKDPPMTAAPDGADDESGNAEPIGPKE